MIIFFNKKTGNIFGTIDGIVHSTQQRSGLIKPSGVNEDEIGSYVVSYKPVTKKVIRPITKMVVDPSTLEVKTIKAGEKEVDEPNGFVMTDPLKEFFTKVSDGVESLYNYRFIVERGFPIGVEHI